MGGAATGWTIKQRAYSCAERGGGGAARGLQMVWLVGGGGQPWAYQISWPSRPPPSRYGRERVFIEPLLGPQRHGKVRAPGTEVALSSVTPGHLVPPGGTREPEKTLPTPIPQTRRRKQVRREADAPGATAGPQTQNRSPGLAGPAPTITGPLFPPEKPSRQTGRRACPCTLPCGPPPLGG